MNNYPQALTFYYVFLGKITKKIHILIPCCIYVISLRFKRFFTSSGQSAVSKTFITTRFWLDFVCAKYVYSLSENVQKILVLTTRLLLPSLGHAPVFDALPSVSMQK